MKVLSMHRFKYAALYFKFVTGVTGVSHMLMKSGRQ
jgi:hypothetical protein